MNRCPDCGCADVCYRREGSWLAIVCGWCDAELHGIDVTCVAEAVTHEAA